MIQERTPKTYSLRKIGLCAQIILAILDSIINMIKENLFDNLTTMRMSKIFT